MNNNPNTIDRHKQMQEANKIMENLANNMLNILNDIANAILNQKDYTIAMAFTKQIGKLLRDNGFVASYTMHKYDETEEDAFAKHYGVVFNGIDFSEHDKPFRDEISKLKSDLSTIKSRCVIEAINDFKQGNYDTLKIVRIGDYEALKKINDELAEENKQLHQKLQETAAADNLPYEPIAVAEMLINRTTHIPELQICDKTVGDKDVETHNISELRQIAERLLMYCNNNKDEG